MKVNKYICILCAFLFICNIYQSININKVAKGYEELIERMQKETTELHEENRKLKRQLSFYTE